MANSDATHILSNNLSTDEAEELQIKFSEIQIQRAEFEQEYGVAFDNFKLPEPLEELPKYNSVLRDPVQ